MDSGKSNQQRQQCNLFWKTCKSLLKRKENPNGIFFGLTNAYDVINHKIKISKPSSHGVRCKA